MLNPPRIGDVCITIAPRSFGVSCAICVSLSPLAFVDQVGSKVFTGFRPGEVVGLCAAKRAIVTRCMSKWRESRLKGVKS